MVAPRGRARAAGHSGDRGMGGAGARLAGELTMTTWSSRARRDAPLGFSRILVGVQRAGHLGQAHAEFRHQHKTLVAAYDLY